jgi:tetratricopeptide (TPR) repeat protein
MRVRTPAAAALLGVLAAAALAAGQTAPPPTIVVLPFDTPRQDTRLSWLSEGAALLLSEMLDAGGDPAAAREERLSAFERLQIPPLASLSRASSIKVGLTLGVTSVVIGGIESASTPPRAERSAGTTAGADITVRARVIRLDSGRLLPEVRAAGPLGDLYGVFARLSAALHEGSGLDDARWGPRLHPNALDDARWGPRLHPNALDDARWGPRLPPTPPVFELYVKGLIAETPSTSLALFEQVLKAAPGYDPARVSLWQAHTDAGDHARALSAVSAIEPQSRRSREGRFLSALSLIHLARWDEALQVLRALQAGRPAATVANAIGVVELRRAAISVPGRATYYFSQASELDPADGDVFFNLGYAYWLERDARAAIYWLREAVRRNPADGDAHFVLAAALQQTGAAAESVRERELASRLSSKYAAWTSRPSGPAGDVVPRGLERLHEALAPSAARMDAMMSTSEQRDQEALARFHLEAGRRAVERETDREAIQELRRALYLSPYMAEAHLLLGRLYLRGGRTQEAIDALKIALWSGVTAAAHVALAEAFVAAGDRAAAKVEVDRALELDPKSVEAQQLRARLGGPPW